MSRSLASSRKTRRRHSSWGVSDEFSQRMVRKRRTVAVLTVVAGVLMALLFGQRGRPHHTGTRRVGRPSTPVAPVAQDLVRLTVIRRAIDRAETVQMTERSGEDVTLSARGKIDIEAVLASVRLSRAAQRTALSSRQESAFSELVTALRHNLRNRHAWATLGQLLMEWCAYEEAVIAWQCCVRLDPHNEEALNNLGVAHFQAGDLRSAESFFFLARLADEDCADASFNEALVLLAQNYAGPAEAAFREHVARYPADYEALRIKAFLQAAAGQHAESLESLEEVLQQHPAIPALLVDAASSAALLWRPTEALGYLERAGHMVSIEEVFQEPAFTGLRLTPKGRAFSQELAMSEKSDMLSRLPDFLVRPRLSR